jgi:hypothetical protein
MTRRWRKRIRILGSFGHGELSCHVILLGRLRVDALATAFTEMGIERRG